MTTKPTVLDRYIELADSTAPVASRVAELRTIFSTDATVHMFGDPVVGLDAILEFYRNFYESIAEGKHYWTTTQVDDHTLEAEWVAALRMNGRLVTASGHETARLNADGLIFHLRNVPRAAQP